MESFLVTNNNRPNSVDRHYVGIFCNFLNCRYRLRKYFRYDFTSKIKRMYDDITNSATQQEEYNKTVDHSFQGTHTFHELLMG